MQIAEPDVVIISNEMPTLQKIELCGRVCYKSEDKIKEGSAARFVKALIERGHTSVLEHARVVVPGSLACELLGHTIDSPYGFRDRRAYKGMMDVLMNARDFVFFGGTVEQLAGLEQCDDYMTVRFTCDRAIANELVRHRTMSFSQESTRYVGYHKHVSFIRPVPFEWADFPARHPLPGILEADERYQCWYDACGKAEEAYKALIDKGCTPQEARSVLPLSTKTDLVVTGLHTHWADLLKLRMASDSHPQMRHLMRLLTESEQFPEEIKNKLKG